MGAAARGAWGRLEREGGGGSGTSAIHGDARTTTLLLPPTPSTSLSPYVPVIATMEDRQQAAAFASAVATSTLVAPARRPAAPRLANLSSPADRARVATAGRISGHRFIHDRNNEHARTHTQHRSTGLPGTTDAPCHTPRDEDGATMRVRTFKSVGGVTVPSMSALADANLVKRARPPSADAPPASLSPPPLDSMCAGMHPVATCVTVFPSDNDGFIPLVTSMRFLIGRVVVPAIVKTNNHRTSSSAFAFALCRHVAVPAIVKTNGHRTGPSQMLSIVQGQGSLSSNIEGSRSIERWLPALYPLWPSLQCGVFLAAETFGLLLHVLIISWPAFLPPPSR